MWFGQASGSVGRRDRRDYEYRGPTPSGADRPLKRRRKMHKTIVARRIRRAWGGP